MYLTCTNAERVFGFTLTVNSDIEKTGEEIRLLSLLFGVYSEVKHHQHFVESYAV
jgi:hypothetical protein